MKATDTRPAYEAIYGQCMYYAEPAVRNVKIWEVKVDEIAANRSG